MGAVKQNGTYIQCTNCGEIYHTRETVPIDRLYVTSICPGCGHERGLNCGDNRDDIALYYDPVLDERFYRY